MSWGGNTTHIQPHSLTQTHTCTPHTQSTPTPPPTAPKTTRPRPSPANQGSLRKGGGIPGGGATGPETVLDSSPVGKGGVSQKIQQLLNTLKRPKKNRRPIEEYYQDQDEGAGECGAVVDILAIPALGFTELC